MNLFTLLAGLLAIAFLGKKIVGGKLEDMAKAIMDFEGWFPGSRANRNNNPGNLKFAGQVGAVGTDKDGFAIFRTFQDGWNALVNQLRVAADGRSKFYNPEMTLLDFFRTYAPGRTDNPVQYANFVAGKLQVPVSTKISELV